MKATFLQTSDPHLYADLLAQTSRTVRAYARRSGCAYESYTGIKRGYWPWQASFNRIYQLQELCDRGYRGWVIYVDADAYVYDQSFSLEGFLNGIGNKAFAATPSGASANFWDTNNGVFFLNLSHRTGRHIVRQWRRRYEAVSDSDLRRCTDFHMGFDDQSMLHSILQEIPTLYEDCVLCPWELINSPNASFIRQHLRAMSPDLPSRLAAITSAVNDAMARR